jgi:hypothetical protein
MVPRLDYILTHLTILGTKLGVAFLVRIKELYSDPLSDIWINKSTGFRRYTLSPTNTHWRSAVDVTYLTVPFLPRMHGRFPILQL